MRCAIYLYTNDSSRIDPESVNACISVLAPVSSVRVSRTVEPMGYYESNKRLLAGLNGKRIVYDLELVRYTELARIGGFYREGSVLSVSFSFSFPSSLRELAGALELADRGQGSFPINGIEMSFGPVDLIEDTEDAEGNEDVELIDVTQFSFMLVCDDFSGRADALLERVESLPSFKKLRQHFESILGPLTLHFSR